MTIIVVMIGAVGTLAINDALRGVVTPIVALVLATLVLLLRWRQRIFIAPARPLAPQQ